MLCGVLVVFILVVVSPSPFSAATNTNSVNFNEWFNQLNAELRVIYQNAAHFAWELRYLKSDNIELNLKMEIVFIIPNNVVFNVLYSVLIQTNS